MNAVVIRLHLQRQVGLLGDVQVAHADGGGHGVIDTVGGGEDPAAGDEAARAVGGLGLRLGGVGDEVDDPGVAAG